jgi:hypothetical protein
VFRWMVGNPYLIALRQSCPSSVRNRQICRRTIRAINARKRRTASGRMLGHMEVNPEHAPAGDGGSCLCDNLLREANSPQQFFEARVRPEIVNPQVRFEVPGDIQGSLLVSSF